MGEGSVDQVMVVDTHSVMIGEETYSLTEIPGAESGLVKAACASVLGNLDLDRLVANLELCKQLIYLARNGVQGAGSVESIGIVPRITTLHSNFVEVCGRANRELSAIAQCSVQIQDSLLDVYDYLYEGEFKAAVRAVERFSDKAQRLASSANELAAQFDGLGKNASGILGDTQVALGKNELAHARLQEQVREFEIQTDKAKRLVEKLRSSQKKLEKDYEEAKEKAQDAEGKAFSLAIVGAIFKPLAAGIGAGAAMYAGGATGALRNRMTPAPLEDDTKAGADKEVEARKQEAQEAEAAAKTAEAALADADEAVVREKDKEKALAEEVERLEALAKDGKADTAGPPAAEDGKTDVDEPEAGKAEAGKTEAAAEAGEADAPKTAPAGSVEEKLGAAKSDLKAVAANVERAKQTRDERDIDLKAARKLLEARMAAVKMAVDAAGEAGDKFTKMGDDYQTIARAYRKEVSAMRKLLAEQADQEHEALGKVQEYAARMKNAGPDLKGIELACDSLFQAVGALKQIVAILQEAGHFWGQMADACLMLKDARFASAVSDMEVMSERKRLKTLAENKFQQGMLAYYAGWKALEIICQRFAVKAGEVRVGAARDFQVNLSTEDARREARRLGETLLMSVTAGIQANEATKRALEKAEAESEAGKPKSIPAPVAES